MNSIDLLKHQPPYPAKNPNLPTLPKRWLLVLFFIHLLPGITLASSVRQVTIKEMIEASDLVFEGRVARVESRSLPNPPRISTYVTFQVLDIIKGPYSGKKIQLSFLGGTIGDLSLVISDMHVPERGQKGVYFVESLTHRQVHPLYGWDQGHFLIKTDRNGIDRIMTRNKRTIIALGPGEIRTMGALSSGVALGVSASDEPAEKGLTVGEFKRRLREMVRVGR